MTDLEFLLDTVIWMSGSDDFSSDGKAGVEWARRRERVYEIMAVRSEDPEPTDIGFGYVSAPDGLPESSYESWDAAFEQGYQAARDQQSPADVQSSQDTES